MYNTDANPGIPADQLRQPLKNDASPGPETTRGREELLVELVDQEGEAIGSQSVSGAHSGTGALHRAFSVMLIDAEGRVLLQQRASVKSRFAGFWSNTCCGHPAPGQSVVEAAESRLAQEIALMADHATVAGEAR